MSQPVAGDGLRIGVYVCHCGTSIARTVKVASVADELSGQPNVVVSRLHRFMCSDPGLELIRNDVRDKDLNRIVVAGCSPLMHESTFRAAVEEIGLNRCLFEIADIRRQVSRVTEDRQKATGEAIALVKAAVARVSLREPREIRRVPITPRVMVVGAGIAGIEAALQMADAGFEVIVVEKEASIGGHTASFDKTFPTLDGTAGILTPKMVVLSKHPNVKLLTWAEVEEVKGHVGNFNVKVRKKTRYVDTSTCRSCGACYEACPSQPRPAGRVMKLGARTFRSGDHLNPNRDYVSGGSEDSVEREADAEPATKEKAEVLT